MKVRVVVGITFRTNIEEIVGSPQGHEEHEGVHINVFVSFVLFVVFIERSLFFRFTNPNRNRFMATAIG
jgi:hypothetical protein